MDVLSKIIWEAEDYAKENGVQLGYSLNGEGHWVAHIQKGSFEMKFRMSYNHQHRLKESIDFATKFK